MDTYVIYIFFESNFTVSSLSRSYKISLKDLSFFSSSTKHITRRSEYFKGTLSGLRLFLRTESPF